MFDDSPGATLPSNVSPLRYPTVGVAIRNWLNAESARLPWIKDLTDQWSLDVESQLQMNETMGSPIFDQSLRQVPNRWQRNDSRFGSYEFGHIRIPHGSYTDTPSYNDRELRFPLDEVIEAAGLTGWDWKNKRSISWGYDFDTITGHAAGVGITDEALAEVRRKASELPYVEIRRSTGGGGLHLRIYNTAHNDVVTSHTMHAAGARAALQIMSKDVGFNFGAHVDVYGAILWIWHTKINEENRGLELIKPANPDAFAGLPENWQDHAEVVTGKRSKVQVRGVGNYEAFEALAAAREKVTIDETHKLAEQRIAELGYSIVWNGDHNNWQTHTKAFQDLLVKYPEEYKGFYETLSEGTDPGKPNCFVFPLSDGAFKVVKYGQGSREHETWNQNGSDWTWTYFNRPPSLRSAGLKNGGAEDVKSRGVTFAGLEGANQTIADLGGVPIDPNTLSRLENGDRRQVTLYPSDDGRVAVQIPKSPKDPDAIPGWIKRRSGWERVQQVSANMEAFAELDDYDGIVRGVVDTENTFAFWTMFDKSKTWNEVNKDNIKSFLRSLGNDPGTIEDVLGRALYNPWRMVNVPFAPEYPGERQWNQSDTQLAFPPAPIPGAHPTWDKVLRHQGADLDERIRTNSWFAQHGIRDGGDYLRHYIANLIRHPFDHLPYLFFFGPQDSGKSTFHEACALLMTGGVVAGDTYLQGKDNFNSQLASAVLCVVEETDLGGNSAAYNRLKGIVTAEMVLINPKYQTPYMLRNTTSWVQTANHASFCPASVGDTRVTSSFVPTLPDGSMIPKKILLATLKEEAPAFLRTLFDLRLPPPASRLLLPPLGLSPMTDNYSESTGVPNFINTLCEVGPDYRITTQFAYEKYVESCGGSFTPVSQKKFKKALIDAGLELDPRDDIRHGYEGAGEKRGNLIRSYQGFRLKSADN